MAAVAVIPTDLGTTAGTYPIRIGASVAKPSSAADNKHYTSVRYNHKPQIRTSSNVTATIKAEKSGEHRLRFKDGGSSYGYTGREGSGADEGQYVLVLKGEGKDREAVLEKLSGAHAFNLVSAPTGTAAELARLHPYIGQANEVDAVDEVMVGDDEASDEEADESNPFDYRHFLKAALAETAKARKPAAAAAATNTQTRVRSTAPVYVPPAKRNSLSGARQQPVEKRKLPVEKPSAGNKRSKPNHTAPTATANKTTTDAPTHSNSKTKKTTTTDPNLPRIHLDRKASLRKSSYPSASHPDVDDDDDGELVLENETPTTNGRQQQSAMSRALSGQFLGTGSGGGGRGPISLHSAATSPAGSLRGVGGGEEDGHGEGEGVGEELDDGGAVNSFDFEFRDDDDDDEEADAGVDDADHEDDDDDADVEDLELPSPVRESRPSISAATVSAGVEEDDLDAQLAAAMAEEAEEEESEEE